MTTIRIEIAGLKEAYIHGAIDRDCFNRNMSRLILELELCGGVA